MYLFVDQSYRRGGYSNKCDGNNTGPCFACNVISHGEPFGRGPICELGQFIVRATRGDPRPRSRNLHAVPGPHWTMGGHSFSKNSGTHISV